MNEMFTELARKAIENARDEATRLRHDYVGTEHLLLGLIRLGEGRAIEIISNIGLELQDLKQSIEDVVQPSGGTMTMGQLPLTARAKKTLDVSSQEARALKSKDIDTEHILLALLKDEEGVASQVLSMYDISYQEAYEELKNIQAGKPSNFAKKRKKSKTPALDHFGRDLTELARRGRLDPIIGRTDEIERVSQILSRRKKNNPVLIGEPGVDFGLGDEMILEDKLGRRFIYQVNSWRRLEEANASIARRQENAQYLNPTTFAQLTLVTCWPPTSNTHRVIVTGLLSGRE